MFTNRISKIVIGIVIVAAALFTVSFAASPKNALPYAESGEQILREYQLGEKYGEMPQYSSVGEVSRENFLGERYGQTPDDFALRHPELNSAAGINTALADYRVGEQTLYAHAVNSNDALEVYRAGEKNIK